MAEYVPQAWRFGDNGYYAESYAKHMAALGTGVDYDDDDFDRYAAQFKADLEAHDAEVAARTMREFIAEADESPAVTWGGRGGIKELAIIRHNRIERGA